MARSLVVAAVALAGTISCGGAQDDATPPRDASAPEGDALDAGPAPPDVTLDLSPPGPGCPSGLVKAPCGYWAPPSITLTAAELGLLRFTHADRNWLLAERASEGGTEIVAVKLGAESSGLGATVIDGLANEQLAARGLVADNPPIAALCGATQCALYEIDADSGTLAIAAIPGSELPASFDVRGVVEGPCVFGDGLFCLAAGVWQARVPAGSGPLLLAAHAGLDGIWAVGKSGRMVHVTGSAWSEVSSGVDGDLHSVDSSGEDFAAGGVAGALIARIGGVELSCSINGEDWMRVWLAPVGVTAVSASPTMITGATGWCTLPVPLAGPLIGATEWACGMKSNFLFASETALVTTTNCWL